MPLRFTNTMQAIARCVNGANVGRCANDLRATHLSAACLVSLLACLTVATVAVEARPQPMSTERILFESANRERTALGLPQLHWDESLAAAARQHAELMVQYNALSHQFSGEPSLQDRTRQAGARYSVIAENVAMGPSADVIHSSWMHSPPHRANLLDRDLTAVGIAVVATLGRNSGGAGGGTLFAVEDFSQAVVSLSFEQQEKQVSALLAARGLQVANSNGAADDARKTCEMDRGFAGSRPNLVVRYEASDLSRLPDDLEQKIRSGNYRTAAVGACDSGGSSRGFTRFRITVLLY
jgi:uncharacterized protein YkwD